MDDPNLQMNLMWCVLKRRLRRHTTATARHGRSRNRNVMPWVKGWGYWLVELGEDDSK